MYRKKCDPTSDLRLRFITKRGKGKEIPVDIKYKWVTTQHMAYGITFKRLSLWLVHIKSLSGPWRGLS